jgi:biopolymer transport protein ExbD
VDVVLVLLIIFMLTAHVMEFGLEVDVPQGAFVKEAAQEMPVVSITKDGTRTLNGKRRPTSTTWKTPSTSVSARPRASTSAPTRKPSGT